MECIDLGLGASVEAEVEIRRRRISVDDVDVGEARRSLELVELGDSELREDSFVEADAFREAARVQVEVVDDHARPIPVLLVHAAKVCVSVSLGASIRGRSSWHRRSRDGSSAASGEGRT